MVDIVAVDTVTASAPRRRRGSVLVDLDRRQVLTSSGRVILVVGLIVIVTVHTLTYPADKKKAGRALRTPAEEPVHLPWSGWYIVVVALAGAAAGLIAWGVVTVAVSIYSIQLILALALLLSSHSAVLTRATSLVIVPLFVGALVRAWVVAGIGQRLPRVDR